MKQSEIDIIRREFGLTDIDDPSALHEAIRERFTKMNALERAEIQTRIGRKVEEAEAMLPNAKYSPSTWALLVTCFLFSVLAAGAVYLILDTHIWMVLKIVSGVFAIFWFLAAWQGGARIIYRLTTKRDF